MSRWFAVEGPGPTRSLKPHSLTPARKMASTAISSNCHHLLTSLIKLRRQARERRQYVYAKSLEAQERLTYERKRELKDALASGKSLPTELRKEARELGKDFAFDEAQTGRFFSPLCFCVWILNERVF